MRIGQSRRLDDALVAGFRAAISDVLQDRRAEYINVLAYDPDGIAPTRDIEMLDGLAVHPDRAGISVVEAADQVDQRGLAGARRPRKRGRESCWNGHAHVPQRRLVATGIGEGDTIELDSAREIADRDRPGPDVALVSGIQQPHHLAHSG